MAKKYNPYPMFTRELNAIRDRVLTAMHNSKYLDLTLYNAVKGTRVGINLSIARSEGEFDMGNAWTRSWQITKTGPYTGDERTPELEMMIFMGFIEDERPLTDEELFQKVLRNVKAACDHYGK